MSQMIHSGFSVLFYFLRKCTKSSKIRPRGAVPIKLVFVCLFVLFLFVCLFVLEYESLWNQKKIRECSTPPLYGYVNLYPAWCTGRDKHSMMIYPMGICGQFLLLVFYNQIANRVEFGTDIILPVFSLISQCCITIGLF